jgi:YHS domain-containing protein
MNIYGMREHNTILGQKCDTCGKDNLTGDCSQVPITINFGWGSELDGEEYHFCSYNCLIKFAENEQKKEN